MRDHLERFFLEKKKKKDNLIYVLALSTTTLASQCNAINTRDGLPYLIPPHLIGLIQMHMVTSFDLNQLKLWVTLLVVSFTTTSRLKGLFTIFFLFSARTHILNSYGVWYSWFWSEGPKNAPNSRFLGFYFVPRPRLAAQGTSSRGAVEVPWRRPLTKVSYTTHHYYSKYEFWPKIKKNCEQSL